MNRTIGFVAALLSAVWLTDAGHAQSGKPGVEKLYILNCGEGTGSDVSRWSPGVDEGKSIDFVDNCYLIKHAQGWMLWDTGIPDAVAAMPNGLVPADPKGLFWHRPKTWRPSSMSSASSHPTSSSSRSRTPIPIISAMSRCFPPPCSTCRRPNMNGLAPMARRDSSRSIPSPSLKATMMCSATAA